MLTSLLVSSIIISIINAISDKPNIVIFMADDIGKSVLKLAKLLSNFVASGWADVGWNDKDASLATHYLQQLAEEGLILNQHYAHPVCSPSRAALMTGNQHIY